MSRPTTIKKTKHSWRKNLTVCNNGKFRFAAYRGNASNVLSLEFVISPLLLHEYPSICITHSCRWHSLVPLFRQIQTLRNLVAMKVILFVPCSQLRNPTNKWRSRLSSSVLTILYTPWLSFLVLWNWTFYPLTKPRRCHSYFYRVSLSLEAPNYCLCIKSKSAGFSFVNTGKQLHLKHARRHFERNLVKDVHHRSVPSRNWLKS